MGNCLGITLNKKIMKDSIISNDVKYYDRKLNLPIGEAERHYQKSNSTDTMEEIDLLAGNKRNKSFSF